MEREMSIYRLPMTVITVGNVLNASQPSLGRNLGRPRERPGWTAPVAVWPNPGFFYFYLNTHGHVALMVFFFWLKVARQPKPHLDIICTSFRCWGCIISVIAIQKDKLQTWQQNERPKVNLFFYKEAIPQAHEGAPIELSWMNILVNLISLHSYRN